MCVLRDVSLVGPTEPVNCGLIACEEDVHE